MLGLKRERNKIFDEFTLKRRKGEKKRKEIDRIKRGSNSEQNAFGTLIGS